VGFLLYGGMDGRRNDQGNPAPQLGPGMDPGGYGEKPWVSLGQMICKWWFFRIYVGSCFNDIQASDKVVPVLGKNRCALGKCVSQKSCL